jgi:hypothetical protein
MDVLQSHTPQPSVARVIWTDFGSFSAAILPVISWVLFVVLASLGSLPDITGRGRDPLTHAPSDIYLAIGFTVVMTPILLWRVLSIRGLFADGIAVPGTITDLSFFRGRGWVKYTYTHQDVTYRGWNSIMKTGRAGTLKPGDQVTIVLRRENPKRAAVCELYL